MTLKFLHFFGVILSVVSVAVRGGEARASNDTVLAQRGTIGRRSCTYFMVYFREMMLSCE